MADTPRKPDRDPVADEVDRLLRKLPGADPALKGTGARPTGRAGAPRFPVSTVSDEPTRAQKGGTWALVVLGVLTAAAYTQWPWAHDCGIRLYGYVAAVLLIPLVGLWASALSWTHRMVWSHLGGLTVMVLGGVLLAGVVLPRVGYASREAHWTCGAATPAAAPRARSEDVATLDGILAAFYDVVSGPPGARDWSRDSTLYAGGARFVELEQQDGVPTPRVMDRAAYVAETARALARRGYYAREIGRAVSAFGGLTHVLSAYEVRAHPDSAVLGRGINSLQLFWDGYRWWISHAARTEERPDLPLPAELLP